MEKKKVNPKICIDIIEKALKDCANLKRDYEFLSEHYNDLMADYNEQDKLLKKKNDDYIDKINIIDRKLKALEIIAKKQVDIHNLLQSNTVEQYNNYAHWLGYKGNLTQEEFALLKEVLE